MSDPGVVLVLAAQNLFAAQLAATILDAEGIPDVSVPDVNLSYVDFNAARQAMGLEGCNVYVPAAYAERAKAILAEARAHPLTDEDERVEGDGA